MSCTCGDYWQPPSLHFYANITSTHAKESSVLVEALTASILVRSRYTAKSQAFSQRQTCRWDTFQERPVFFCGEVAFPFFHSQVETRTWRKIITSASSTLEQPARSTWLWIVILFCPTQRTVLKHSAGCAGTKNPH